MSDHLTIFPFKLPWTAIAMFHGVLALLGRSLRVDARSLQSHLARLGLMGAIYFALCVQQRQAGSFGAPGMIFFSAIGWLDVIFMTVLGISFFSTPISEEKEEDTLGLMMMAGISPLGILVGKIGGRLMQALLLIAVQYAFTLLAITMGGVTQTQVTAMYLALAAYLILLTGFGAFCSTVAPNNRAAATWMTFGLSAYVLIPRLASYLVGLIGLGAPKITVILDRIARFSVFEQLGWILTTGFGDPMITWQGISNVIAGLCCFGLAWGLFGIFANRPAGESVARGLLTLGKSRLWWLSPGRPWGNPFVWKDFYFVSGGLTMIPGRLSLCAALFLVALLPTHYPRRLANLYIEVSFFQIFLSLGIAIDAGRVIARSLSDEIRGQTLSTLMILPRSTLQIVYSKLAGALIGWLPGAIVLIVVTFITADGRRNCYEIFREPMGLWVTSFFILIPHVALLLSVYLRWGAVSLGVVISIATYIGSTMMLQPITNPYDGVFVFGAFVVGCMCVACHVLAYLRLQRITAGS